MSLFEMDHLTGSKYSFLLLGFSGLNSNLKILSYLLYSHTFSLEKD